ncbi:MAG: hypothetical protein CVU81_02125 [Euryarchaeota archaeon HGW-Euryarchaeota-1]|nr:MAG: hypothetical protein CVU81_02125 [Euryarchaeota archaeon HGW-Euryarchaeota-1]
MRAKTSFNPPQSYLKQSSALLNFQYQQEICENKFIFCTTSIFQKKVFFYTGEKLSDQEGKTALF